MSYTTTALTLYKAVWDGKTLGYFHTEERAKNALIPAHGTVNPVPALLIQDDARETKYYYILSEQHPIDLNLEGKSFKDSMRSWMHNEHIGRY